MGSQIALLCARAGYTVDCQDIAEASLERARTELQSRSQRDVEKGRRTAVEFVKRIGKTPIVLEKEIHGFVANRILNACRDERRPRTHARRSD